MEYEIDDDPQGLPEHTDGERDGGLNERLDFRKRGTFDDQVAPDDMAVEQLGEPV